MLNKHGNELKCLILCAGLGTRLRPLTLTVPKPLATVYNVPLFDVAFRACSGLDPASIAINAHHLAPTLTQHAKAFAKSVGFNNIEISLEQPSILGTGGALIQLSEWWGSAELLVYNGDILSDISLKSLLEFHRKSSNLVTLAVRSVPPKDGARSIWLDENDQVRFIAKKSDLPPSAGNLGLREVGFACAYVASPQFRAFLPRSAEFYDVVDGFNRAIVAGNTIKGVLFPGLWIDIGSPRALWEANLALAMMPEQQRIKLLGSSTRIKANLTPDCHVDSTSILGSSVILGAKSSVSQSVLLEGAVVKPGEKLARVLRGLGFDEFFKPEN